MIGDVMKNYEGEGAHSRPKHSATNLNYSFRNLLVCECVDIVTYLRIRTAPKFTRSGWRLLLWLLNATDWCSEELRAAVWPSLPAAQIRSAVDLPAWGRYCPVCTASAAALAGAAPLRLLHTFES